VIIGPEVGVSDRLRWFVGTLNRLVVSSAETGGAFGLMEQWAPAGFSPPLHVHHREDSALYVLDGELLVQRGEAQLNAGPGDCVFLPRDEPHTFLITSSKGAHFLELVTPGGFEQFHVDASDIASSASLPTPAPPDVPRLVAAIGAFDAEIIGPPMPSPAAPTAPPPG